MTSLNYINQLISLIAKLPGLGQRSARRISLHLLENKEATYKLASCLDKTMSEIKSCEICGNIDSISPCNVCIDEQREHTTICIVESISDLWAIERSKIFKGKYHVLGHLLSALNNITPENLHLNKLTQRIEDKKVKEIIIAISATLDGQTTCYYIMDMLAKFSDLKVTRLAFGIPIGAELEYMDEGTLSIALQLRQTL